MARVFIGIGSNISPVENIQRALLKLKASAAVKAVSMFYHTDPVERPNQDKFYNGIVELETEKTPEDLLKLLNEIESECGRVRTEDKFAAREIDLDILVYSDLVINESGIVIPDADIYRRDFIAIPLASIAGDFRHPGTGESFEDIASRFDSSTLEELSDFTEHLKRKILNGPA